MKKMSYKGVIIMPKALDLTGKRFGSLVALNKEPSQNGHTYWKFKCDCGKEKVIQTAHVTQGLTKTCGCGIMPINDKTEENIFQSKRICPICGKEFQAEDFGQIRRKYCFDCSPPGNSPVPKFKAMKRRIVEIMGGQCEICGYNKCLDALEFHHKDPSKKDFQICCTGGCPSFERLLEEAKKCQLLCANCHREEHWRLRQEDKD